MIKVIIFDVGGTLLGAPDLFETISNLSKPTKYSKEEIYNRSIEIFGSILTEYGNENGFKTVSEILEMTLLQLFECNQPEIRILANDIYWNVFVDNSYLINDAKETLDLLFKNNIKMIICSDADSELIHAQFKMHNISKYFTNYCISSDVKAYKPNDLIVSILGEIIQNYNLKDVLFVGDSSVDIEVGKKIGVNTVRVGQDKNNLYGEDYSITSLRELLQIIQESP